MLQLASRAWFVRQVGRPGLLGRVEVRGVHMLAGGGGFWWAFGVGWGMGSLIFRKDVRREGVSDGELRAGRRRGELARVHRGVYVERAELEGLDVGARHVLAVRAAVSGLGGDVAVSHQSAAIVLGLPVWNMELGRVHVTACQRGRARKANHLHVHSSPFDETELTIVDGMRVLSPARTVADLARALPFEEAVVVGDAAMRDYRLTTEDLLTALDHWPRRPGAAKARRVIAFMDARSESSGESRSRVRMHWAGLPKPELQHVVTDAATNFLARVDFALPELGIIGEFDGRAKYDRLLRPHTTPARAVYEEKLREDAIRAQNLQVLRWTWPDLDPFHPTATRWRHAINRAAHLT
ncbi:type IV toxin-antitoxin system AbiEi family antitoxin domain-containing protein [Nocardia sp. NPDC050175]|uniref:type IV toxin-antitoxin system AbiEi family antitoxin domain-containing protein n=1 Tax=Nocardia sp. NPDC050175 TaxID=3364317 RepID=UPI0037A06691